MKFQYTLLSGKDGLPLLDSRGKMVKRPMLSLILTGENGDTLTTLALIDSGADTTTVGIQFAEYLGVELKEENKFEISGVGKGTITVYRAPFPFEIKEMKIKMEVPAWYVDSENVNVLIGQEVFFEVFKIKFEKDHNTFEIIELKKKKK